jgi:hypothetical protein
MPKTSRTHPSNYRNFMKHILQPQDHRYAYRNEYKLPLKTAMRMIIQRIISLPYCSTAAYCHGEDQVGIEAKLTAITVVI